MARHIGGAEVGCGLRGRLSSLQHVTEPGMPGCGGWGGCSQLRSDACLSELYCLSLRHVLADAPIAERGWDAEEAL
jgi:hypothetical protein